MFEVYVFLLGQEDPVILHHIDDIVSTKNYIRFFRNDEKDLYAVHVKDMYCIDIRKERF